MRTNRSPLNQDLNKKGTPYQGVAPIKGMSDEVARNIDEDEYSKPTQRDINTAKQANEKMKMLKDKSFNHRYNQGELLDEVVIKAKPSPIDHVVPHTHGKSQKEGKLRRSMTQKEGKLKKIDTPERGVSRKSALNMLGVSSPLNKRGLWDNIHAKRKRGEAPNKPGDKGYPTNKALKDSQ